MLQSETTYGLGRQRFNFSIFLVHIFQILQPLHSLCSQIAHQLIHVAVFQYFFPMHCKKHYFKRNLLFNTFFFQHIFQFFHFSFQFPTTLINLLPFTSLPNSSIIRYKTNKSIFKMKFTNLHSST